MYIPKYTNYTIYKKIIELLDTLPNKDNSPKPNKEIEDTNSINYMETELNEYISKYDLNS